MKTNVKVIAATLAALIAGYVAGAYLGLPGTTAGNNSGDISKVSKYNKISVSPALSAFQERIMADSTELAKAAASLTVLTSRMKEFSALVTVAEDASKGYEELQNEVSSLLSVKKMSDNAVNAGKLAIASFNSVASGLRDPLAASYEQTSQNLTIAYLMVDRQISLGKEYVASVDKFLNGKNPEDYAGLACARDLWAAYCAGDAQLSGDKEEIGYWAQKKAVLSSEVFADTYTKTVRDSTLASTIVLDNALGLSLSLKLESAVLSQEAIYGSKEDAAEGLNLAPGLNDVIQSKLDKLTTELGMAVICANGITLDRIGALKGASVDDLCCRFATLNTKKL